MTKNIINAEYGLTKKDQGLIEKRMITMTSVAEDCELLKWAGICFGDIDTYKLQHSIKKLSTLSGGDQIRFVGKIMARECDYWVVSGVLNVPEKTDLPESRGTGVNTLVYWVTDNLIHDWV